MASSDEDSFTVLDKEEEEKARQNMEVPLSSPLEGGTEPVKRHGADSKTSTVRVEGVDQNTDLEKLEMYFESKKRSDGGDITAKDDQRSQGFVLFTFEETAVAERVASRPHTLGKVSLSVTLYKQPPDAPRTVSVSGLKHNVSKDFLQFYFDREMEKAGEDAVVEEVELIRDKGEALVTFSKSAAVTRILGTPHRIKDNPVNIALPTSFTATASTSTPARAVTTSSAVAAKPKEQPRVLSTSTTMPSRASAASTFVLATQPVLEKEPANCTVEVRGLKSTTSEDTVRFYFENKRSGGGEVDTVDLDSDAGLARVTFQNAEDAARVTSKQHTLDNAELEVRLYRPPKMMQDCVLLTGLPHVRTSSELQRFVKAKCRQDVKQILFGRDEIAVVTFEDEIDWKQLQTEFAKFAFKGQKLTVAPIPESDTLLVRNFPQDHKPTADALLNYFENTKRSGGGRVLTVDLASNAEYALVKFEDSEVAARVSERPHKFSHQIVDVSLYMECLGPSGGSEEPLLRIPEPVPIGDVDQRKISLLEEVPACKEALASVLKNCDATLNSEIWPGNLVLACGLTVDMERAREKAETWQTEAMNALQTFLGSIQSVEVAVSREEFTEMEGTLRDLIQGSEVGISYNQHDESLSIIYRNFDRHRHVYNAVRNEVRNTQEKLKRKKLERYEKIKATQGKLMILRKHTTMTDIQRRFPDVNISFMIDSEYLELRGTVQELEAIKGMINTALCNFTTLTHVWTEEYASYVQALPMAPRAIKSACLDQDLDGFVEFTSTGFHVHSSEMERAQCMLMAGKSVVQKMTIKLEEGNETACAMAEWAQLIQSLQERNRGALVIREEQSGITLVGVHETFADDEKTLKRFLEDNSVLTYVDTMMKPLYQLFEIYQRDSSQNASQLFMNLTITYDEDKEQVIMKGNKRDVEAAKQIIIEFCRNVKPVEKIFKQPSMGDFLKSTEWTSVKRPSIEQQCKCKILDPKETAPLEQGAVGGVPAGGIAMGGAQSRGTQSGISRRSTPTTRPAGQPRPTVSENPRIFLNTMSDITKEEHDVLVNSSNSKLDLQQGQVSKALLSVGGPGIQKECKTKYPQGIKMGEIAVTGPGVKTGKRKLLCKNIIHCCLPELKDRVEIKKVIKKAVLKCLNETKSLGLKSIGFPALGTGILRYPPDVVAEAMYETVMEYGRQNPDSSALDVIFIMNKDKKDEGVRQAFGVVDKKYKQLLQESIQQQQQGGTPSQSFINPNAQGVKSFLHFKRTEGYVSVTFLTYSQQGVDQAEQMLIKCYEERVVVIHREIPTLPEWDDLHIQNLIHPCSIANVDLTFNFSLGTLELRGLSHNVDRIQLHQTMKEAEDDVTERHHAHLLSQQVQWSYEEVGQLENNLVPYNERNNYKIEMGYRANKPRVIVMHRTDDVFKPYNVDFTTFTEIPEDPAEAAVAEPLRVIRQDIIQEIATDDTLPHNWSSMGSSVFDKVSLKPDSLEYKRTAETFTTSMKGQAANIVKIFRVQNLTLHRQYTAMKQLMERQAGRRCEKDKMWHGTVESAVDGIIKYGFNRSYSDRSNYGQGVYFAAEAKYSSMQNYAKINSAGERNMFLCKVLVGEFVKGDPDMRFPPQIPNSNPPRNYDTTVDDVEDPSIFVIFKDVQAYPEYLIVFK